MILVIGEILFDIYPTYRRLGGAPFNFSFHLKKLGMPVHFVSKVGRDESGRQIIEFLQMHGFEKNDIQVDDLYPTGKVHVELDNAAIPTFNIEKNAAYDRIGFNDQLARLMNRRPKMIYFGTLIQRTAKAYGMIQKLLYHRHTHTKAFYDINLRDNSYTEAIITASLKQSDIVKMNLEELKHLGNRYDQNKSPNILIPTIMAQYGMEGIVLTRGERGGQWYTQAGRYRVMTPEAVKVIDTVGAGDAYAAMAAIGYLKNWPVEKTLFLAQHFAAKICTVEGALPASDDFYDDIKEMMSREYHEEE